MTYDITIPGRHDTRNLWDGGYSSLAAARAAAQQAAHERGGPVYIESVSARGTSRRVETVREKKQKKGVSRVP